MSSFLLFFQNFITLNLIVIQVRCLQSKLFGKLVEAAISEIGPKPSMGSLSFFCSPERPAKTWTSLLYYRSLLTGCFGAVFTNKEVVNLCDFA